MVSGTEVEFYGIRSSCLSVSYRETDGKMARRRWQSSGVWCGHIVLVWGWGHVIGCMLGVWVGLRGEFGIWYVQIRAILSSADSSYMG